MFSADLFLDQPISPEMVIFYITQDTQRHPILPELKSGFCYFPCSCSSILYFKSCLSRECLICYSYFLETLDGVELQQHCIWILIIVLHYPPADKMFGWIGGFRITGRISTQCSMLEPLSGELTVEASALPICSIDIHLLRVESVLFGGKIITETSLIQTTQVQFFTASVSVIIYLIYHGQKEKISWCIIWHLSLILF